MHRSNLALLLVLILSALLRWGSTVTTPAVLPDEWVYVNAARHLDAGRSPYTEPIYFYPPPIASFIHHASPHLGEIGALQALRSASLAGLVVVVLLALKGVAWPWFVRFPSGILFISLAPAVKLATGIGNVAGLAAALTLLGLGYWERRPIVAGLALGLGLAIKPVAPLAPLLLALHRPLNAQRQHWLAAISCAAAGIAACVGGLRFLPGLLNNAGDTSNPYNFSLQKALNEFGLEIPVLLIPTLIAAAALLFVRRRRLGQQDLMTVAVTTSLVALPILWAHSLLLLLPTQLLTIDRCADAFNRWSLLDGRRQVEVALAVLAVASTLLSHAVGTTPGLPEWSSNTARIVPLLSIPYLGWFVFSAHALSPARDRLLD